MSLNAAFCVLMFWVFLMPPQIGSSAEFPPGVPGVIFTAEETQANLARLSFPDLKSPFWTPSAEQIYKFEEDFRSFFRNEGALSIRITRNLVLYKRQFFGCTTNGVKTIFVNFFCEQYWRYNDDWRTKMVVSRLYSGDCFFTVRYNPLTREFFDLLSR